MSCCAHGLGQSCLLCAIADAAAAAEAPPRPYDRIRILEARIADLEADQLQLRRRVSELEHRVGDRQGAHNALATASEQHETRIAALEQWL